MMIRMIVPTMMRAGVRHNFIQCVCCRLCLVSKTNTRRVVFAMTVVEWLLLGVLWRLMLLYLVVTQNIKKMLLIIFVVVSTDRSTNMQCYI